MEMDSEDQDMAYRSLVGERIRSIRKQKRLSLQEVEARSEAEFKASVLGAYERAERAISVPRLQRLANFYNVPVDQLLPGEDAWNELGGGSQSHVDADMTERSLVIDLTKLSESKTPESVDSKAKDIIKSMADTENMDEANKKAYDVLITGTEKEFLKHMFTNQETGQPRSYAEMRMMYG